MNSYASGPDLAPMSSPQPQDEIVAVLDPLLAEQSFPSEPRNPERRPSVHSVASSGSNNDESDREGDPNAAPSYPVQKRVIGSVEVPMIVMNLERAEMAFGNISSFKNIMDIERLSIPFYLNPDSPYRRPIMSHHASAHNLVLKVVVPKRTGRKRKRGSNDPFEGEIEMADAETPKNLVCSKSRLDNPKVLRRKLQDNVDRYHVEAVGIAKGVHRFRGLADFHWSMEESPFVQNFQDKIMSADIAKIRDFAFRPGTDLSADTDIDILPPPTWSSYTLPFNYGYAQNPYVRPTLNKMGGQVLVNTQMPNLVGYFLSADEQPVPTGPQFEYSGPDPDMATCIALGKQLMDERPIWTRRSLLNALGSKIKNAHIVKRCAGFVGYQFRGGPFRDAVIKYGVDPRTDPKYRKYQTLIFNMRKLQPGYAGETWHSLRSIRTEQRQPMGDNFQSHIFDGKAFWTDSKIWQICDITDPLIVRIVEESPVRPECGHMSSGWFHGPTWAKLKAVMKTKMMAIQFGRKISDDEYSGIVQIRDTTPPPGAPATRLPVPDLKLTEEEMRTIYGKNWKMPKNRRKAFEYRVPGRKGKEVEVDPQPEYTQYGFSIQDGLMEGGESGEDDEGGDGLDEEEIDGEGLDEMGEMEQLDEMEEIDELDEALGNSQQGHRGGQPTNLMEAAAGFGNGHASGGGSRTGLDGAADDYDEDEDGDYDEGDYEDGEEYDGEEFNEEEEEDVNGRPSSAGPSGSGTTWGGSTEHGWTGQSRQ